MLQPKHEGAVSLRHPPRDVEGSNEGEERGDRGMLPGRARRHSGHETQEGGALLIGEPDNPLTTSRSLGDPRGASS